MKTFASLFGGGGLCDIGAMAAGMEPIWSVEYDPAIAEVHSANVPGRMIVARVEDVNPAPLERPDVLHASPPCTSASVANSDGKETAEDKAMAEAVCHFLRVLTPPVFTLENVSGYRRFQSYQRILATLDELGYWTHSDILNSADYSVPQTRKRLILRAVRDGIPAPLPSPVRWVGWYEAIEDLLPSLPESKFADWQLSRLPDSMSTLLACVAGENSDVKEQGEPAPAITTAHGAAKYRAFLVDCQNNGTPTTEGERGLTNRQSAEPSHTITGSQNKRTVRAWLDQGRVVSMTPRALGRFQSLPDSYRLPEGKGSNALACRVIGNGVPCLLMQRIYEGLA